MMTCRIREVHLWRRMSRGAVTTTSPDRSGQQVCEHVHRTCQCIRQSHHALKSLGKGCWLISQYVVFDSAAHTTQFTLPGDSYFKHGSGVGHLDHGGSYVTFKSKDGKHMTIVIETMVKCLFCFMKHICELGHVHGTCLYYTIRSFVITMHIIDCLPAVPGPQISNQTAKFIIKGNFCVCH